MANILQVTTPNLNTDNRNTPNPMDPRYSGEHSAVRNPVDPTRVVRADGRDGEQTGNTGQKDVFGAINYESNYSAFIKGLGENQDLAGSGASAFYGCIHISGVGQYGDQRPGGSVSHVSSDGFAGRSVQLSPGTAGVAGAVQRGLLQQTPFTPRPECF